MLEKKNPMLLILEFLTVSLSVPKERYRALSPLPPVFLLHFKTKLQYYKESMRPDSSLPYSNSAQAHCRQSHSSCSQHKQWESSQPSLPVWHDGRFWSPPHPLLQTQAWETPHMEEGWSPVLFSSAPLLSTADNWDLCVWWLYCTRFSLLGEDLRFVSLGFFKSDWNWWVLVQRGWFWASSCPKESSGPTLRKAIGLTVVEKVKALLWRGWTPSASVHSYSLLDAGD